LKKISIDAARFLSDIKELSGIGGHDGNKGVTRLTLTSADIEGRRWFVDRLEEIGLNVLIDKFGNIAGILEGRTKNQLIAAGSHLDTVVEAGRLDGAYGVVGALAVLRAVKASGIIPEKNIGVINFTNEEGIRFKPDMMGSVGIAGYVDEDIILSSCDSEGISVAEELDRSGFAGHDIFKPTHYLELHIEQGPVLESAKKRVGIVRGIQGLAWWDVTFSGQACHAGAFPMNMRRDPLAALADFSALLPENVSKISAAVGTIGIVEVHPKVINIVPGKVNFSVDARCPDPDDFIKLKEIVAILLRKTAAQNNVECSFEIVSEAPAIKFPEEMVKLVEECALKETDSVMRLTSGAGHDAQFMHIICPAAMIFVPSEKGLSHCPQEETSEEDLVLGVNILGRVMAELAI
jgi:N-carbamoyl-L-amino-acid hydrolase